MSTDGKKSILREGAMFQGILLGGFAMAAAALLAFGNEGTYAAIQERKAEDLKASINQVIPPNLHDNNILDDTLSIPHPAGDPITVYQAQRKGQTVAVAYRMSGFGYGGEIAVIMGIEANGKLLGVRVLSHTETPGLGDKIEEKKDDWILKFNGLSLGNPSPDKWAVKKDGGQFDQFSGATITPRTVVTTIKRGLEFFNSNKVKLLAPKKMEAKQ
ncbi:MAG: electron transport complex subunit RsxG [Alphaproteobacteria bacterium]|nr:electron transport complex subunit RsxG [Rhodospirillales bacterium]MCW9046372.1 electron transport complex subunit RsxG [Alphaproteobacteria bacterium]